MPVVCAVYGCTNRSNRERNKGYFRVPKIVVHKGEDFKNLTAKRRQTWLINLNLKSGGAQSENWRVCSDHFLKGCPSAVKDVDAIDWAPSVNLGYQQDKSKTKASHRRPARLKSREDVQTRTDGAAPMLDLSELVQSPESEYLKEYWCEDVCPRVRAGTDHDYAVAPAAGALDAASVCVQQLEAKVQKLETKLALLKGSHLHFHRFCASDEDIRFYTRFPSEEVFNAFWEAIQPSASMLVYWSKAQEKGQTSVPTSPGPIHRLQLIDEFFLYCCCVAAGLKEKMLADIFQVSESTVCRIVITWANYLYLLLGSLPIWMSRQQVRSTMPLMPLQYCPEVRVIIDCTEVQCQSPPSLIPQSDVCSSYTNTTTFKGLIGIAPCGAVIFVSSLYTSSISDRELFERCGMLDLLEPGDGCMADKGFDIENMLADRGVKLIMPPFETTEQFSKKRALKTQTMARLQILVESAIRRVKEYHIWDSALPLTLSGTVNQLWTNCCLMTNFQGPL